MIDRWTADQLIDGGLSDLEQSLLAHVAPPTGKALSLLAGEGREAIALGEAGLGYQGDRVDFVPAMVESMHPHAPEAARCAQADARGAEALRSLRLRVLVREPDRPGTAEEQDHARTQAGITKRRGRGGPGLYRSMRASQSLLRSR